MVRKNNKLEALTKEKRLLSQLNLKATRNPSLFALIKQLEKPIMAIRAGFYSLTSGYFAHSNRSWFKILVLLAGAYILLHKNLKINFNLNSPDSPKTEQVRNLLE